MTPIAGRALAAIAFVLFGLASPVRGQQPVETKQAATATPAESAPAALPLAEIPDQAETVSAELRAMEAELTGDPIMTRAASSSTLISSEVEANEVASALLMQGDASLGALRRASALWQRQRDALGTDRKELTTRAGRIERAIGRLIELDRLWSATLAAIPTTDTPNAVRERTQSSIASIRAARARIDRQQTEVLAQLDQVARLDGRVGTALAALESARLKAVGRLFARQHPVLWRADASEPERRESTSTFTDQWQAVMAYAQAETLGLHAAFVALLAAILFAVRRRIGAWTGRNTAGSETSDENGEDRGFVKAVFDTPIAAALVLSVLGSRWIYAEAPPLLWAVIGALALVATVRILRRVVEPWVLPILYAVLAFYLIDQIRPFLASAPATERLLFIAQMLVGAVVALLVGRRVRSDKGGRLARWTCRAAWLVVALFLLAAAANALGFTSLAELLAHGVLGSAYSGVIVYAAALIVDAIALLALHARPLTLLHMVQSNRGRIWHWARKAVRMLALGYWLWLALERLTVRERALAIGHDVLVAGVKIGALDISVGDVLAFVITILVALGASKMARFVFEEDVVPRVNLPRGLPYAISRTMHNLILAIGFLLALATLGVDMTKFTILIGALTVGIGFGLQNIINNFVSGLILLFERPVRVGDVIQMDDQVGVVERIGIRASVIRTASGADVILPNGKFIPSELGATWINYVENGNRMTQDERAAIEKILQEGSVDDPRKAAVSKP